MGGLSYISILVGIDKFLDFWYNFSLLRLPALINSFGSFEEFAILSVHIAYLKKVSRFSQKVQKYSGFIFLVFYLKLIFSFDDAPFLVDASESTVCLSTPAFLISSLLLVAISIISALCSSILWVRLHMLKKLSRRWKKNNFRSEFPGILPAVERTFLM